MTLTTVFSSPKRGKGGKASWRGNHPPTLSLEIFKWLKPRLIADPMCGSGTTGDAARQAGIQVWEGDLHQDFNALVDEIPVMPDLAWLHPPYHDMIVYSGRVWGKTADPNDLSRAPNYETFLKRLNQVQYNAYQALRPGGHLAVLVGDLKRQGKLYPIQRDMRWYGEPVNLIVKTQHNVQSSGRSYSGNFVPIMHEYLVVTRKPKSVASAWLVTVRDGKESQKDQRKTTLMGWNATVWTALQKLGGTASLQNIYKETMSHARVKRAKAEGTDWQAIIRRTLQETCKPVKRGVWALPVAV